jgi:hypothetical protein
MLPNPQAFWEPDRRKAGFRRLSMPKQQGKETQLSRSAISALWGIATVAEVQGGLRRPPWRLGPRRNQHKPSCAPNLSFRSARIARSFSSGLTFAFCRAACAAQRAEGVDQQRAVRHHPGLLAPYPLHPVADAPVLASETAEVHLRWRRGRLAVRRSAHKRALLT